MYLTIQYIIYEMILYLKKNDLLCHAILSLWESLKITQIRPQKTTFTTIKQFSK